MATPIQSASEKRRKSVQELENPEVKGRILIHANTESNSLFVKPKISGFKMARRV